jgi:hypothetical protein
MAGNTTRQRNHTSLSSKKIRIRGPSRDALGRKIPQASAILGPMAMAKKTIASKERQKARLQGVWARNLSD